MKRKAARFSLMALLIVAMLTTMALSVFAADYTNVPAWGNGTYKQDVIPDRLDGRDANDKITRAEFAAVIYEAFGDKITDITPAPDNTFTDTNDPAVLWAYAAQIIVGVGNNKFNPDANITRQDIAVMCTRAVMKASMPWYKIETNDAYTLVFDNPPAFADENTITEYAKIPVSFMAAMGIIQGRGNGIFDPLANASLLETGIMATKILDNWDQIMEVLNNTDIIV